MSHEKCVFEMCSTCSYMCSTCTVTVSPDNFYVTLCVWWLFAFAHLGRYYIMATYQQNAIFNQIKSKSIK